MKAIAAKSNLAQPEIIASWCETSLLTLLSQYKLKVINNVDEFGFFYQCSPNKAFYIMSGKYSGDKHNKISITGVAATDAIGVKPLISVIGQYKNLWRFKNIKSLPS